MGTTHEIPSDDWATFFDAFSRIHRGWRSRVEVLGKEFGAQEEGKDLPLIGVSGDFGVPGRERVVIALGREPDDHVSHAVLHPAAIRLLQDEEGAVQALEIESADRSVTLLRFESSTVPEAVNGLEHEIEPARSR